MIKFIIKLLSPFFIVCLIWFFQGYVIYGNDIVNYRLDFKRTLESFDREYMIEDCIGKMVQTTEKFMESLPDIPEGLGKDLIEGLSLFASFVIYIFPFGVGLIVDVCNLLLLILKLLFMPRFIPI